MRTNRGSTYKTVILVCFLLVSTGSSAETGSVEPRTEDVEFFEQHVRPLLVSRCFECHGAEAQESDLRLDRRDLIVQGGASGEPAAIPGDVEGSLLVKYIRRQPGGKGMPPETPLSDEERFIVEDWI